MSEKIFISHNSSKDAEIARRFADLLKTITSNPKMVWYSSEQGPIGGIEPGDFKKTIHNKIDNCELFVILLTKNSISSGWVNYEIGYAAANNKTMIPITIGIEPSLIDLPIKNEQFYTISSNGIKGTIGIILKKLGLELSDKLHDNIIKEFLENIFSLISNDNQDQNDLKNEDIPNKIIFSILNHLDSHYNVSIKEPIQYSLSVFYNKTKAIITIGNKTTYDEVLDAIYFMISNYVPAYSYLEKWVLKDKDKYIICEYTGHMNSIPANKVFIKGYSVTVIFLDKPIINADIHEIQVEKYVNRRISSLKNK